MRRRPPTTYINVAAILALAAALLAMVPASFAAAPTIVAASDPVTFGDPVTISGTADPAAGTSVTVQQSADGTTWTAAATAAVAADGTWSAAFEPQSVVLVRAVAGDGSVSSTTPQLTVVPRFVVTDIDVGTTLVGSRVRARVSPASWSGRVRFAVRWRGRTRNAITRRPRQGSWNITVPAPGIGRMTVVATIPAADGLAARSVEFRTRATARTIGVGSRGADVAALGRRLRELNFHAPTRGTQMDIRLGDAVLAFHKARRMSRTRTVDLATWEELVLASPMRAKHRTKGTHVEVDKTRQILMVVRRGRVIGTIHVSTGATGNTPEGRFAIYQRGGSYLYRFMGFIGNFGMHGYVPVPVYPASHGCVREPMWTASWTWRNTALGTPVFIYR